MASKKGKFKKEKTNIYDKYQEILAKPNLLESQIDQMRRHLGLLARTICEHIWVKKFC